MNQSIYQLKGLILIQKETYKKGEDFLTRILDLILNKCLITYYVLTRTACFIKPRKPTLVSRNFYVMHVLYCKYLRGHVLRTDFSDFHS